MRNVAHVLLVAALSISTIAHAQKETPPSPPAQIAAMAWMKGYWAGEGYGGEVETAMSPPKAGVMLGWFRHTKSDGKAAFYEICSIEEYEGSLRFVIKHFHPNWIGWEEKDYAHQAKLTRLDKDTAVFGNMTIRRTGPNAMEMEILITAKDGQSRKEILRLKRRPL
jgi:hypothetical protein